VIVRAEKASRTSSLFGSRTLSTYRRGVNERS
jgi:hypothetical protein